jgi:apolipoprotein N-acyltransferase
MSVPPPLGIIGVASPLTAAGLLFPGTAWLGLTGTVAAIIALALRPATATAATVLLAAICNMVYPGMPKPPVDWEAVNTELGDVGRSAEAEFKAVEFIQQHALSSHAHVMIFPETVIPRWTEATDLFWEPTLETLARSGKTVLIGTTFDIPSQPGYDNGIVVRGSQTGRLLQQIPVPIGMWNPLQDAGAELGLFRPVLTTVSGRRVAVVLCFEELLTWPMMKAIIQKPDTLVGVDNRHWCPGDTVAILQNSIVDTWGRLAGVPTITATNN